MPFVSSIFWNVFIERENRTLNYVLNIPYEIKSLLALQQPTSLRACNGLHQIVSDVICGRPLWMSVAREGQTTVDVRR